MATTRTPPLVSASWLHDKLTTGQNGDKPLVLDSSWTPDKGGRDLYKEKHIPGALFFDMDEQQENPTQLVPLCFPSISRFTKIAQSLGVHSDSHVVVYDIGDIHCAARTWWTFRAFGHNHVSLLDGGLTKWIADGYQTESGEITPSEKGIFVPKLQEHLVATYEDVLEQQKTQNGNIIDVRFSKHYQGKSKEPTQLTVLPLVSVGLPLPENMHKGHIKGSTNIPFLDIFDQNKLGEYWVFAEKEKLRELFKEKGVDLNKPMTTMCYGGNAANIVGLAANILGKDDVRNYYGSWSEWAQRAPDHTIEGPDTEQSNL